MVAEFIFSRYFLKKRISDRKARKIFVERDLPLKISDLKTEQHNIHYAIAGNDSLPTLIFIHGSPGSWGKYINYMYDPDLIKKFRMVSIDRPGFGYSNFGEAMHLQDQCKLIEAVLNKIKNDKSVYVCGHSYAGAVVAKLAADDPELFATIIIVAGAIDPSQEKRELWREIINVKPLFYLIPGVYQPSNAELLRLKDDLIKLKSDLDKITCNVIFVHGDKDRTVPVENIFYGKKMMQNARSIRAETLHTKDHMIPVTHFYELKKILLQLY